MKWVILCPFIDEETDAREMKLLAKATQPVGVEVEFELRQSELIVFYTLVGYASTALYTKIRTVKHLVLNWGVLCITILKCLKKRLDKSVSITGCCWENAWVNVEGWGPLNGHMTCAVTGYVQGCKDCFV